MVKRRKDNVKTVIYHYEGSVFMNISIDREKIVPPMEKMINKIHQKYYTLDELNEISLLIAKLVKFSEKKKDQKTDVSNG